ncbi:MAG: metal ABC transporter permease [Nitrososphaerota archaeon]|nr:metal ABC transporter permease [Nitrososphaerota archaeon]
MPALVVLLAAAALLSNASGASERPLVLVTTEVLADLAGAVGEGVVRVESILGETSSATFRMRPSVVERIVRADVFVYIGYGSEARVGELASAVRRGLPTYRLSELLGVGEVRSAFWLSPEGAAEIVDALASILSRHFPQASEKIELNRQRVLVELRRLEAWVDEMGRTIGAGAAVLTIRPSLVDLLREMGGVRVIALTGGFGTYEQQLSRLERVLAEAGRLGAPILLEAEEEGTTLREVAVNIASRSGVQVLGPVYYERLDTERGIRGYSDLVMWNVMQVVEALSYHGQRPRADAFIAVVAVGMVALVAVTVTSSLVGSFALMRGWAIFGDALSHGAIAGLVAAYVVGADFYLGALAAGLAVALSVSYIERRTKLRGDVAIAVTFTSMLALAVVMLSMAGGATLNIEDVLFADVLAVSDEFLLRSLALSAASIAAVLAARKPLTVYCVDPVFAESVGLRTSLLHYGLLALLSGTVITAFMTVGAIPTVASFIIPPATAYLLTRSPGAYMAASAAIPAFLALGGLAIAWVLDANVGAATVLVYAGAFVVAMMARRPS